MINSRVFCGQYKKISRRHIEIFFVFFSENSFVFFVFCGGGGGAHFMRIVSDGDNSHGMSNPAFV